MRVEHYEELSSTQDRARQCAGEPDCLLPLLVVADRQNAGRGRQGNSWWTGSGSLAFSLLFDPAAFGCPRRPAPRLALAVGVAIVDAIAPRVTSEVAGHCVGLHWPNDVYVGDGKLAGVLVEVLPDGRHILGIGLNSNNSAADAPTKLGRQVATLRDLTGRMHDPTQLLIDLLYCLADRLRQLGTDDPALGETFDALCLQHDQLLTLYLGDRIVTGRLRARHRIRRLRTSRGLPRKAPPIVLRRHASATPAIGPRSPSHDTNPKRWRGQSTPRCLANASRLVWCCSGILKKSMDSDSPAEFSRTPLLRRDAAHEVSNSTPRWPPRSGFYPYCATSSREARPSANSR